jgi:hypothetical protein
MKVYPVKGGEGLRDPATRRIVPAEGLEVPMDPFWLQRLAHGDVTSEPAVTEPDHSEQESAEPHGDPEPSKSHDEGEVA